MSKHYFRYFQIVGKCEKYTGQNIWHHLSPEDGHPGLPSIMSRCDQFQSFDFAS